ncbi:MAG: UpxY family transcription antiterminator [Sedimentisphaerales bacterium]|nr:UpxY family transcription antiterminator [Sedimentisphaerales bacterium]
MLKLEENPPILYPEQIDIEAVDRPWWVAHTRSRNEKALAWFLHKYDIGYFLPLRKKQTHRKGRKIKVLMPLFSGYLFFYGNEEERYHALTSNRIAQVLTVTDQVGLAKELKQIHQALQSGLPIDAHPGLKKGMRCRVTQGPLMGAEGVIEERKNVTRIYLKVEILGQTAAVEINPDLLEALD